MKWEKQILDNRQDLDKNQIRQMVMESYHDIAAGKGHDYSDFFNELERLEGENNGKHLKRAFKL